MLMQKVNPLNISAIAFKFGFSDAGHFSRLFKERYGSTPREYRKLS
jgi:AraC-like DNA-binding protein